MARCVLKEPWLLWVALIVGAVLAGWAFKDILEAGPEPAIARRR
jgi:hypothetical protein